jgi:hypothetical protein
MDNSGTESDLEIGNKVEKLINKTTVFQRDENSSSDDVESNGDVESNYVYLHILL